MRSGLHQQAIDGEQNVPAQPLEVAIHWSIQNVENVEKLHERRGHRSPMIVESTPTLQPNLYLFI